MKITKLSDLEFEATSHGEISKLRKKVFLRKGEIPHLTQFAQGYFDPGAVARKHKHPDMYEIFFIEKGKAQFIVNDKPYILGKGGAIVLYPGETHEVISIGRQTLIMTYFSIIK